jgi:hypothetical protein
LLVQEKIETVECIFTTGLLYIKWNVIFKSCPEYRNTRCR